MSKEKEFDKYHHASYSKYLLKVHLVFVCKYRKKLLQNDINDSMKQILRDIEAESDFTIVAMEMDKDHDPPTLSVRQMVSRLKSVSTVRVWKLYEERLNHAFWNAKTFWSDGYFASSTGDASAETIKQYIEQQG